MSAFIPLSARMKDAPRGSKLRCSRIGYANNVPTRIHVSQVTSASSAPTLANSRDDDYNGYNFSSFAGGSATMLVSAVNAYSWDNLVYTPEYNSLGTGSHVPAVWSAPYAGVCSDIVSNADGYGLKGLARIGGISDQLNTNYDNSGKLCSELYVNSYTNVFSNNNMYGVGFMGAYCCDSTYWLNSPMLVDDTVNGKYYWQNVSVAQKSRYRVNKACYGFELSCELWIEKSFWMTPTVWTDGWPSLVVDNNAYHSFPYWSTRVKPKNWTYRGAVQTWAHDFKYVTINNGQYYDPADIAGEWNYIPLPTDSFLTPAGTLANGFCGRAIFHVFYETLAQFETRMGVTVAGKP